MTIPPKNQDTRLGIQHPLGVESDFHPEISRPTGVELALVDFYY
ncbi:hypothetical protein QUF90_12790 [Desulfococcaceae bacterium HSG9]|nr:hypothetical protein [Desulfococcaceae bacterium HSG9]